MGTNFAEPIFCAKFQEGLILAIEA